MTENRFVIRVYAIIINNKKEVLISDEFFANTRMTKFPGGGLEWGEGTIDCLKREAMEEFGQSLEIIDHFYTTDYYQKALFYENTQLLSIYYLAKFSEEINFRISTKPFDFDMEAGGTQSFRWVPVVEINPAMFTFPIDRIVAQKIKEKFTN